MKRARFLKLAGAAALAPVFRASPAHGGEVAKQNVLIVVADDMPEGGFRRSVMPETYRLLVDRGVKFKKGYAVDPWCGPARATLFTGRWVHNHGLLRGSRTAVKEVWYGHNLEADTIATRAEAAGARTAMIGKYLFGTNPSRVPRGWDRFISYPMVGPNDATYTIHVNGKPRRINRSRWNDTALIFKQASEWVAANSANQWLLYVAPNSPHAPPSASPEHADDYDGVRLPKPPSYDPEGLPVAEMRDWYEGMLEECRDIDDGMRRLLATIISSGQWERTTIIFTSDNGYMYGEHGVFKKTQPWEESVGVPMVLGGPGVSRGISTLSLAGHVDIPYTALSVLGADVAGFEGRDLRQYAAADWREYLLVEHPFGGWYEVTSGEWTYFERADGVRHLYHMPTDPYQQENLAGQRPALEAEFSARLEKLKTCVGETCRAAEGP